MDDPNDIFQAHRGLLFAIAYRILGSVSDAEDAVQDSWLKWSKVDASTIDDHKAYLSRVATNTALDRLRKRRAAREEYVGPWLPEPLLTTPDAAEPVERAEAVSMAMLVVLETLSPEERAVFILREVFGFPHADIAETLHRSPESVRQLAHRARSHVQARRPRFHADSSQQRQATQRFLDAILGGDVASFMEVLAPDVTLHTDGGGTVQAARNVIVGADKAARFLAGITQRPWAGTTFDDYELTITQLNGEPGIMATLDSRPVATVSFAVEDDLITGVYLVVNPEKLTAVRTDDRQ